VEKNLLRRRGVMGWWDVRWRGISGDFSVKCWDRAFQQKISGEITVKCGK